MKKILLLTLLSYALPFCTFSQTWNQIGDDIFGESDDDRFGFATSLDREGNTIAIGASNNDGNGENAGHVRVFDWSGTSWTQRGMDIEGDAAQDVFGHSVCLRGDGNILAVGAQWNSKTGIESGQAKVFRWESNQWMQMGSDLNGVSGGDFFGQNVQLSNDGQILAVSGSGFSENFPAEGVIRVFRWDGDDWNQLGMDILGGAFFEQMNICDLSADGLTVAAGSWGNNTNGNDSGQARVFVWDGQSWVQKGSGLFGEAEGDRFGNSVRLNSDGNILAVGAPFGDLDEENTGYTKVFTWDGTEWSQLGSTIKGEAAEDISGIRIGLNSAGNQLIIGALQNDGNGEDAGHARVYQLESADWVQYGEDIYGESAGDWAGYDVDINGIGDVIAVGARFNDETGHVRLFGDLTSNLNESSPLDLSKVFPNPSQGHFNVKLEQGSNSTIKVYTMDGKVLYQKDRLTTANHEFHLEAISGLYFLEISTVSKREKFKIVKL